MSWSFIWLYLYMGVCVRLSHPSPPQHRGWLRLWKEGEDCGECQEHLCPLAPSNCPAGLVRDRCDCCELCANAEGQLCDPDGAQEFYGHCGKGLRCRRPPRQKRRLKDNDDSDYSPEPNSSDFQSPQNLTNYTGNDIAFGCEVSAFPLPNVSWKKDGSNNFLPGDDPHISVQARGGPQRFTISTWLQIEGLHLSDAGTYSCISQNALGEAKASAQLEVLRKEIRSDGELDDYGDSEKDYFYNSTKDDEDEDFPISGDHME